MKKSVLLIEPPYLDLYGAYEIMTKPYFPLGLGYIASSLRRAGHKVTLLIPSDPFQCSEEVMAAIEKEQFDIVGLSAMTTNFPRAVDIIKTIKNTKKLPVMIGGPHVSAFKEKILHEHPQIDFVVFGEGELTAVQLVDSLEQESFFHVNGLIWRGQNRIIMNAPQPLQRDLDTIPFPARELVDISKFSTHSHIAGGNSATILTSRGCPFGCVFCSAHVIDGKRYREHSAEYVVSEIDLLVKKYKVTNIFIQDDTFTLNKKRALEICRIIKKNKYDVRFGCFSRTDVMDFEFAKALKGAGFDNIVFGLESGDAEVLKKIGKKTTLRKSITAVEACNRAKLKTTASFVIGLPFDTKETIKRTIKFAFKLDPTLIAFNPLVPFPGAKVFNPKIHTPASIDGWEKYTTVGVPPFSFVHGMSQEELYRLARQATKRFYLRPKQIWKLLRTIQSLDDFKAYVRSAIATMGH